MGNALCGHVLSAPHNSTECSTGSNKLMGEQHGCGPVKSAKKQPIDPRDEIEIALCQARAELDAGKQQCFSDDYSTGKIIGHGAYCKVLACTNTKSGQEVAVKSIQKAPDNLKQREGVVKEVAIMRMLGGHPCAVQLHAVYEDASTYYLVMELCSGGELFDQIVARGQFSEADAVNIMRSLLDFVAYAHSKHIMHRDLKPENILLTSRDCSAQLKVIDFGTSEFCKPGQRLSKKFGTPYYVAPEVLAKDYAHAADVWSAGVIMYILLSGCPPFAGSSDARILQRVQQGSYSFAAKEWEAVSESAKAMITAMLTLEETQRSTAAELLKHPWLTTDASARQIHSNPAKAAALGAHMVRRLKGFAKLSHMKRLALVLMARTLTDRDVARLRSLFMSMDKDDDGRISAGDLHRAIEQVGGFMDEEELTELFLVADITGQGVIDYEEFIAAMLDSHRVAQRIGAVRSSFEQLDRDGDGFISVQDLAQVLQDGHLSRKGPAGRRCSWKMAEELVAEVDLDKDGTVSYEEFRNMWVTQEAVAA